jgi:oligoribonuclease (3'-5' exoribonuclease)
MLVWLDLETTGLDPQANHVLEIALRLSDGTRLDERAFSRIVRMPEGLTLSPFIRDMHTKNGLLGEMGIAVSPTKADLDAVGWLGTWFPDVKPRGLTLAGSFVHFDLGFIRAHMPRLASMLSHRLFDVSAIKLFCESLRMPPLPKAEAHRAMADIKESHAHYVACAEWART